MSSIASQTVVRPNFLFIGPDKTGSSWLYQIFLQHPNIYVPGIKDIYFFDRHYERGIKWYFRFFESATHEHIAVGELSHDYMLSSVAAERINMDLPDVKILTCLRDPVERTFSHYLYLVRSGLTSASFEDALQLFPELVSNSLYAKHLKKYFQTFDRKNIKVLFFDELKKDSTAFAKEAFNFLNVPYIEDLAYQQQVLPASKARSVLVAKIAKLGANMARDLGMVALVGQVKTSKIASMLYKPYKKGTKPVLSPQTAMELRRRFSDDIIELESLLNVNLTSWQVEIT